LTVASASWFAEVRRRGGEPEADDVERDSDQDVFLGNVCSAGAIVAAMVGAVDDVTRLPPPRFAGHPQPVAWRAQIGTSEHDGR
jgi:hypothetical protein